jgi:hypothetical protein
MSCSSLLDVDLFIYSCSPLNLGMNLNLMANHRPEDSFGLEKHLFHISFIICLTSSTSNLCGILLDQNQV